MPYVYSTATASISYSKYKPSGPHAGSAQIERSIVIRGGANLAPLRDKSQMVLMTPRGVVTKVTDEELAFLESVEAFQRHKKRGFIAVEGKSLAIDKVVEAGMCPQDKSAPLTPKSKEVLGNAVAKVNPIPV
jgi:hypothetical protein